MLRLLLVAYLAGCGFSRATFNPDGTVATAESMTFLSARVTIKSHGPTTTTLPRAMAGQPDLPPQPPPEPEFGGPGTENLAGSDWAVVSTGLTLAAIAASLAAFL